MGYKCPLCGKVYGNNEMLMRHLLNEHGDEPYIKPFKKLLEDTRSPLALFGRTLDELVGRVSVLEDTVRKLEQAIQYVNGKLDELYKALDYVEQRIRAGQSIRVRVVGLAGERVAKKIVLSPEVLMVYNYVYTHAKKKGLSIDLSSFINSAILDWARVHGILPGIARVAGGEESGEGEEDAEAEEQ